MNGAIMFNADLRRAHDRFRTVRAVGQATKRRTAPSAWAPHVAVVLIATSACGLNTNESFEEIPSQDIPFGLEQPTSTTTTPTLPPTTDDVPPVSDDDTGDGQDPSASTSTLALPAVEAAEIYQVVGLNRLQRQTIPLSAPLGVFQVVAVLEEPPSGELTVGLRTAVRVGLVADVAVDRGVATVDLNGTQLNRMSPRDQRLAIAQLVLSITSSIRGVGQVAFSVDGEPAEIGIPPDYTLSDAGQPLAYADFAPLLLGSSLLEDNGGDDNADDPPDDDQSDTTDPGQDETVPE